MVPLILYLVPVILLHYTQLEYQAHGYYTRTGMTENIARISVYCGLISPPPSLQPQCYDYMPDTQNGLEIFNRILGTINTENISNAKSQIYLETFSSSIQSKGKDYFTCHDDSVWKGDSPYSYSSTWKRILKIPSLASFNQSFSGGTYIMEFSHLSTSNQENLIIIIVSFIEIIIFPRCQYSKVLVQLVGFFYLNV